MPWLFPLQALRALLWVALAVPVILMTKGEWWRAGLAVALLFGVVMNAQLLMPNLNASGGTDGPFVGNLDFQLFIWLARGVHSH